MSDSALVDARIRGLTDWRGETLAHVRTIIRGTDAAIIEEVKWRKPTNPNGVPVWSCKGIICTGEVYKDKVKLTFAKGAKLKDPTGLFNASREGNQRRAIDIRENEQINEDALRQLVQEAMELNRA